MVLRYSIAAAAVLGACLAGWAALVWGQSGPAPAGTAESAIHEVPSGMPAIEAPAAASAQDVPPPGGSLPAPDAPLGGDSPVIRPASPAPPVPAVFGPASPGV